jgi:uncharacterized protein (DUF1015 family)
MAEILPFRAWRYNDKLSKQIDSLTSPLFDVVSEKQRESLYQNSFNSIHLSVPKPPSGPEEAAKLLKAWKEDGVIIQDKLPAIYVYYQYFKVGYSKVHCRKGFICHIRAYAWDENVILRHESTIPKAVNDRTELLENTELHASPTHGLYTDPGFELEKLMDEAINNPIYETEDYQGVRDVLAVIHDGKIIQKFIDLIRSKKIILADGHHRYESSLINRRKKNLENPNASGKEGYNYHLMFLSNTESDDLVILPTHRLIKNPVSFDEASFLEKLREDFVVTPWAMREKLVESIAGKSWSFGILFKEISYTIHLKQTSLTKISWPFPDEIKKLDLTVLHYFVIEKGLGVAGKIQRQSENIEFERSFEECLNKVDSGQAQMAIITNGVTIDDVKKVCATGYTMPQKSTYFFPKVVGGFLFSSIREEEFHEPIYSPFHV